MPGLPRFSTSITMVECLPPGMTIFQCSGMTIFQCCLPCAQPCQIITTWLIAGLGDSLSVTRFRQHTTQLSTGGMHQAIIC